MPDDEKNDLNLIPPAVLQALKLKYLNLGSNRLVALPEEINNLQDLEILILDANFIKMLPEEIGALKNLKRLDLQNNSLRALPENIGALRSLEILNIGNNQVFSLPDSIINLAFLKHLALHGNPLRALTKTIKEWLKELKKANVTVIIKEQREMPAFFEKITQLPRVLADAVGNTFKVPGSLTRPGPMVETSDDTYAEDGGGFSMDDIEAAIQILRDASRSLQGNSKGDEKNDLAVAKLEGAIASLEEFKAMFVEE